MDCHTNYSYFTRKQAGILYSNVKRGKINMTRKDISFMYNTVVGATTLKNDVFDARCRYENAISAIFDNMFDIAQDIIDDAHENSYWIRDYAETGRVCERYSRLKKCNIKYNETALAWKRIIPHVIKDADGFIKRTAEVIEVRFIDKKDN